MAPDARSDGTREQSAAAVDEAITSRRSVRRFLPTPVDRALVERILTVASRAPSGTNMQPWQVYVVGGEAKAALSAELVDAHLHHRADHKTESLYYPKEFVEPYRGRRRKVGWDLYGLLGIEKGDGERMKQQHAHNFRFFDAPVGMFFAIDRILEVGSWLDYGMFLENIMVAARGLGLHTCPQAAFANYHAIIREQLGISEDEVIVCGMSVGYADPDAIENTLVTEREPVEGFTTFFDF